MFRAAAALAFAVFATSASATGEIESLITDADRERLANYEATREEALSRSGK